MSVTVTPEDAVFENTSGSFWEVSCISLGFQCDFFIC